MVHEILVQDISDSAWYQRNKEKYTAKENRYKKDDSTANFNAHRRQNEVSESNPRIYDTYEERENA
jgi:hypothetical protein